MARYSTREDAVGPRFSWHYLQLVREAAIGGLTSNAEIASALQWEDARITEVEIKRWRKQHPRFESVCSHALQRANSQLANKVYRAAMEGDTQSARWWLERRSPPFMPKSRTEHSGVETLEDALKRRQLSDDELRQAGVLYDPEDGGDDDA